MSKSHPSSIPVPLRHWLDEKIAHEMPAFSRPGFCGLRNALDEKSPEAELFEALDFERSIRNN